MNRRAALRLVAALTAPAALSGCLSDGEWTVEKVLGWDDPKRPQPPKVSADYLRTAERVEDVGRQVLALNPFTGLDPLFHTQGGAARILFHRGTAELVISEGLAKECRTDEELAAVLCSELGQMVAEHRGARRVGRDGDAIRELPSDTPAGLGGGAEVAGAKASRGADGSADPGVIAGELLRGAGYDPAALGRVARLIKPTPESEALRKQMAGSAAPPTWQK